MNVGEANAANVLLRWAFGIEREGATTSSDVRSAGIILAHRASRALNAGVTGDDVEAATSRTAIITRHGWIGDYAATMLSENRAPACEGCGGDLDHNGFTVVHRDGSESCADATGDPTQAAFTVGLTLAAAVEYADAYLTEGQAHDAMDAAILYAVTVGGVKAPDVVLVRSIMAVMDALTEYRRGIEVA